MFREFLDSREGFSEEESAYHAYLEDGGDVTNEDWEEMCDHFDEI